jgi:rRNA-processing protein FCF1
MRDDHRMLVVPDSNLLWDDPFLERPRFALIRRQAAEGHFELAVPEVVVREVVNLYREQLTDARTKLQQAIDKQGTRLRHLKSDLELTIDLDIDDLVARYERTLAERLSEAGTRVLPLPDVDHDLVVDRAVAGRRPFKGHDSGYRDTLIWLTLLEAARDDEVVLLSANVDDFGIKGQPEVLHEDLAGDLRDAGLPEERIRLIGSTERFIALHVPSDAQALQQLELAVEEEGSALRADLLAALARGLEGQSLDDYENVHLPGAEAREGSTVGAVDELEDVQLRQARGLSDDEVVLELSARVDLSVDYFVFKADWYSNEDHAEGVWVIDGDWNDHYVFVAATMPADVDLVATVGRDAHNVIDLDVVDVATATVEDAG